MQSFSLEIWVKVELLVFSDQINLVNQTEKLHETAWYLFSNQSDHLEGMLQMCNSWFFFQIK